MRTEISVAIAAVFILQGMWLPYFNYIRYDGITYFIISCATAGVVMCIPWIDWMLKEHREEEKEKKERNVRYEEAQKHYEDKFKKPSPFRRPDHEW